MTREEANRRIFCGIPMIVGMLLQDNKVYDASKLRITVQGWRMTGMSPADARFIHEYFSHKHLEELAILERLQLDTTELRVIYRDPDSSYVVWPSEWTVRQWNRNEPCDSLEGPCACGVWHRADAPEIVAILHYYNAIIRDIPTPSESALTSANM